MVTKMMGRDGMSPGATTIVGSEHVARSAADGYTLLINTLPLVVNPASIGSTAL